MKSLHCFGTFLPVCWVSECLNIYVPEYSLLSYLEMFPESEVTVLFLVLCLVPGYEIPESFGHLCAECHLSKLFGVNIAGTGVAELLFGYQSLCHSSLSFLGVRSQNTLQGW